MKPLIEKRDTQPLLATETLFTLLKHLVNASNFADRGLAAATALAKRIRAFRLTYTDIDDATRRIAELLK